MYQLLHMLYLPHFLDLCEYVVHPAMYTKGPSLLSKSKNITLCNFITLQFLTDEKYVPLINGILQTHLALLFW